MNEDLINTLRGFGRAYPEEIFSPLNRDEMAAVINAYPGFIDRNSAEMGRHCAKFMAKAADEIERLDKEAVRYELVRKLTAQQFAEIYKKNIESGVPFDHLVDELAIQLEK